MKSIRSDKKEMKMKDENISVENYEFWIVSNENDSDSDSSNLNDSNNSSNDDSNSSFQEMKLLIQTSLSVSDKDETSLSNKDWFKKISKKMKRLAKIKMKKRKSLIKRLVVDDFDSDVSKSFKRFKSISFVDFLIEVQIIKSKDFAKQFEIDRALAQQRFETEMKQINQHYEELILHHQETILKQKKMITMMKLQHEKIMMRLKIELKKTFHK